MIPNFLRRKKPNVQTTTIPDWKVTYQNEIELVEGLIDRKKIAEANVTSKFIELVFEKLKLTGAEEPENTEMFDAAKDHFNKYISKKAANMV